jgi:acyl-ACP thioesterase
MLQRIVRCSAFLFGLFRSIQVFVDQEIREISPKDIRVYDINVFRNVSLSLYQSVVSDIFNATRPDLVNMFVKVLREEISSRGQH